MRITSEHPLSNDPFQLGRISSCAGSIGFIWSTCIDVRPPSTAACSDCGCILFLPPWRSCSRCCRSQHLDLTCVCIILAGLCSELCLIGCLVFVGCSQFLSTEESVVRFLLSHERSRLFLAGSAIVRRLFGGKGWVAPPKMQPRCTNWQHACATAIMTTTTLPS
jgi:hypothetical protein